MKKVLLLASIAIHFSSTSNAQNDVNYTHYMFANPTYNPAAVATKHLEAAVVVRRQWVGLNGSPFSQLLNINSYVQKLKGGVGLSIINDKLGYESTLIARLSYAPQFKLGYANYINVGISVGFMSRSLNTSKLVFENPSEAFAQSYPTYKGGLDLGAGVEWNYQFLKIGVGGFHLDKNVIKSNFYQVPKHLYSYISYRWQVSSTIVLQPSITVRSSLFTTQPEASLLAYFDDVFWVGAGFRHQDAMSGLLGFKIKKKYKIGYSYDYNYDTTKKISGGSHEFYLMADFGNINPAKRAYKTPRLLN